MTMNLRPVLALIAICSLLSASASQTMGATILKLNLGGTGPDVGMDGLGEFSTVPDGNAATTGDQDTNVEFTDFLDGVFVDIPTTIASFTLSGVARDGAPNLSPGLIVQQYIGGSLQLYGPAPMNELLLDATLAESAVIGLDNGSGNGSFFNVTVGTATAGTLLPYVVANSIGINMPLTNVTTGGNSGFLVQGNVLQPFEADASANITADAVPEPATALMVIVAGSISALSSGRRRS